MSKVTIAIPVYNVEKYVEKSILSALNQTYDNIELLIVDDKGSDASMEIIRRIQSTHPRGYCIRIIDHGVNKGLGAARNTAIDNAIGDYLYFMDSDDTIEPDAIRRLCDVMMSEKVDMVEGSYQVCSVEGSVLRKQALPSRKITGEFAICKWMKECRLYYDGYAWNKLYNLHFLKFNNIRCIQSHRNEDVFFSFQVVIYAKSIVTLSDITYCYLMRPGSIVNQVVDDFYYNQYLEIFRARTNMMKSLCLEKKPESLFNYYLQHFFEWWLRFVLFGSFSQQKKYKFYQTIQEIFTLDCSTKDLIGLRYKIMYNLMRFSSYRYISFFYFVDNIAAKCYNRLNRRFRFFKLPYSHL